MRPQLGFRWHKKGLKNKWGAKVFPDRASPELSWTDLCLEKTPTELHNGTSFTASWAQGTLRRLSSAQGLELPSWTDSRCEGTGSSEASSGFSMHTALAAVMLHGEWGHSSACH